MNEHILSMPVSEMTSLNFECECGKRHSIDIGDIIIDRGVSDRVYEVAKKHMSKKTLLVADCHTWEVLGEKVYQQLTDKGCEVRTLVFPDKHLFPNNTTLGELLIEASDEADPISLMIAVGSGTLNDVTRYISGRLGLPYIIVGTAPSMDGYAGNSSPIICRNNKISFFSHYPDAIIADTDIMAAAPEIMIAAGFGDVVGKYVSLADWRLGKIHVNETHCEFISRFMGSAVEKCVANVEGVAAKAPEAIKTQVEVLCLSGLAMGLATVTRPASGSEHQMTHFCDLDCIANGRDYPLHGNTVGVATIATLRMYEMAREDGLTDIMTPSVDEMIGYYKLLNAPTRPEQIGLSRELWHRALMEAKDLRDRMGILRLSHERGRLAYYADIITKEMCD
ncbi:MAG: sn-glycerol-1-phosphate dehydrogenase [Clostridiales bacterium]|nr:sn-glycerol-1-phosphate dehydrogenase [Clostridiales bacterium]